MHKNIIKANPKLGPAQRELVQRLFAQGAGHPGVLQDRIADMTEQEAQLQICGMCQHCENTVSQA
jgi:hypothetical protein